VDTDHDGLGDYFEDGNGDGLFALGDLCAWQLADTDGDGLGDRSDPNPLIINLVPSIGTLNPSKCPLP
jgi:hypothetical protein